MVHSWCSRRQLLTAPERTLERHRARRTGPELPADLGRLLWRFLLIRRQGGGALSS
jgi:hypothetical protein